MWVCVCVCDVCVRVCIYICVCIFMYVYVYIYTYTYTYIYMLGLGWELDISRQCRSKQAAATSGESGGVLEECAWSEVCVCKCVCACVNVCMCVHVCVWKKKMCVLKKNVCVCVTCVCVWRVCVLRYKQAHARVSWVVSVDQDGFHLVSRDGHVASDMPDIFFAHRLPWQNDVALSATAFQKFFSLLRIQLYSTHELHVSKLTSVGLFLFCRCT